MKITIFGMGYVGCVTAACLADHGHDVTGVDVDRKKVEMINHSESPIIEPGLTDIIKRGVNAGRLRATTDATELGAVSLICVGTPGNDNGSLGLQQMLGVVEQIGELLRDFDGYHVVTIRSTVLPGTVENIVIPLLEKKSYKTVSRDFGVCMNPEFMRETTAVDDFYHPPFTIIGQQDLRSGDLVAKLYESIEAPLERPTIAVAEMLKYACNAFHAVKVCFANEIGNTCKSMGIDSHRVMELFCKDTKLNLSSYYLKPGFAFGGSCLPKDLRALTYKGRMLDLELPLLSSVLRSNQVQLEKGIRMVLDTGHRRVGVLGISFKAGTDDLRESPLVDLIEHLLGKGCELKVYDRNVRLAALMGANRDFIMNRIPHIAALLAPDMAQVVQFADTLVIG